jgi:hypothetical protein
MKTTTFENAKPGDRVWDICRGWGTVTANRFSGNLKSYSLDVELDEGTSNAFTIEGKGGANDINPILFWNEVKIEAPEQPPRTKLIHGVEIPDISFQPKDNEEYYYPSPSCEDFYENTSYEDYEADRHRANYGLCYPYTDEGKKVASLHAKAMLGIKE